MKLALKDEDVIRTYFTTRPNTCFETLYNRYARKVYNRCYSLIRDSEKAQDFTHDIFIKAFDRLNRFEERSTFSTWLYSISYNYCIDQIRLSKRIPTSALADDLNYQYVGTEESDATEGSFQLLACAMDTIPKQEAQMLRMKYQEGLDVRQIGAQLGLKDSAVKMRLKRSRDKVKEMCHVGEY